MATLVCTIELSKERGVTVKVKNADDGITQTITMDGTTLAMTVAGSSETSSWTQTAEGITIQCKDFKLEASNSIVCTAAKTAQYVTTDADTTITAGGNLVQSATGDVQISGKTTTVSGTSGATLKATSVTVDGSSGLTLKGGGQAQLSGGQVKVAGDAQLSLESSGMATLKGATTTISGSLIKAG